MKIIFVCGQVIAIVYVRSINFVLFGNRVILILWGTISQFFSSVTE